MKESIKAQRHWPLCGEFTGTGEFPAQGPVTRKMFLFGDVIMITWVTPIAVWHVRKRGSLRWPMWWCHLTSLGSPVIEIRRFDGPPIFTMEFPVLVRWCMFYIKSDTRMVTVLSTIKKVLPQICKLHFPQSFCIFVYFPRATQTALLYEAVVPRDSW